VDKIKIKCKANTTLPLDRLKEFQGNIKKISKENREKLMKSILNNGFIAPLFVWDNQGEWSLLDGHQRLATLIYMRQKGYNIPDLPVAIVDADNEEDAKVKLLHITSQYGEFNVDELREFIDNIDLDYENTFRFTDGEIDIKLNSEEEEIEEDEIPEVDETKEPFSKLGDIWLLGRHRLMCGDSVSSDTDKLLNGNSVDLIFTDPPYNVAFNGRSGKHDVIKNDNLKDEDFKEFIYEVIEKIKSINPKAYYIWCNWKFYGILQENLDFKTCIVWAKNVFGLGNGYRHQHEFCLFNGKIDEHVKNESDLWEVKKDSKYVHPTQKPYALSIRAFSNHITYLNVLDLFGGSGSTLIGAEKSGRNSFLMELDEKYVDVIVKRYNNLDKEDITLLRDGKEYQWQDIKENFIESE